MQYQGVVHIGGKKYRSHKSDKIATVRQRWDLLRITWSVMNPSDPKAEVTATASDDTVRFLKTRVMWIMLKYVLNPTSHAYFYKEVQDA
jgi:hypothetical protein